MSVERRIRGVIMLPARLLEETLEEPEYQRARGQALYAAAALAKSEGYVLYGHREIRLLTAAEAAAEGIQSDGNGALVVTAAALPLDYVQARQAIQRRVYEKSLESLPVRRRSQRERTRRAVHNWLWSHREHWAMPVIKAVLRRYRLASRRRGQR